MSVYGSAGAMVVGSADRCPLCNGLCGPLYNFIPAKCIAFDERTRSIEACVNCLLESDRAAQAWEFLHKLDGDAP